MADAKQELDPALVEKAARKIARSVYAEIVSPEVVERNVDSNWQNFKSIATDAILSLGIPAAALNALARRGNCRAVERDDERSGDAASDVQSGRHH